MHTSVCSKWLMHSWFHLLVSNEQRYDWARCQVTQPASFNMAYKDEATMREVAIGVHIKRPNSWPCYKLYSKSNLSLL